MTVALQATGFRVGTSGWAYPQWKPGFYPEKLPQKDFLKFYSTQLNTVEVNYTFRRMLNEKIIAGWLAQTPEQFRFVVKAHQAITHYSRLKDAQEPLRRFLEGIQPLASAGRLGAVLFQLPPNCKADAALLGDFLALLPKPLRAAFEFRDTSWFAEPTYEALRRHNAALCLAESDKLETPDVSTADWGYFRLRKSEYSAEERQKIAAAMRERLQREREIFVFFKHEENPDSPGYARELLEAVAAGKS